MNQIIECVPNFSEGVDGEVIQMITDQIGLVEGVKLLNVDPGRDANRTVVTFAGEPEAVIEAAFRAIKTAGELIDMSTQKGTHPRMGATDVCPLIPVSNITIDEVKIYAEKLAKRVGEELQIPIYLYEESQSDKKRSNLAAIRAGEYEGFFKKIKLPNWKPDFGPAEMDARRGATVLGARDFLIAYNINLNTASTHIANEIAQEVRETGKIIFDENGKKRIPGALKFVKAIGWYIEEYGKAQVSMNLTNISATPIHLVFDEVCAKAAEHGVEVTGSELIGMIPLKAMTDAGRYFLQKQGITYITNESKLIDAAIQAMGLSELAAFDPKKKIIEYQLDGNL
jgi:glutamate formiminotransferase/formiminotetrahydrofolate cyclodeaminase